MSPEECRATYRQMIDEAGETVLVRRYTGTGQNRPYFEAAVKARVIGFKPQELIGGLRQGDQRLILLNEDLLNAQFPTPLLDTDKVVVNGREITIQAPDKSTRRVAGELIAYDLIAR